MDVQWKTKHLLCHLPVTSYPLSAHLPSCKIGSAMGKLLLMLSSVSSVFPHPLLTFLPPLSARSSLLFLLHSQSRQSSMSVASSHYKVTLVQLSPAIVLFLPRNQWYRCLNWGECVSKYNKPMHALNFHVLFIWVSSGWFWVLDVSNASDASWRGQFMQNKIDPYVFPNPYDFISCMGWKIRVYVHATLFYSIQWK